MGYIQDVWLSGQENPCLSMSLTPETKRKLQAHLLTKINWDASRYGLDGVDGDLNIQIPESMRAGNDILIDGDTRFFIATVPEEDLEFRELQGKDAEHSLQTWVWFLTGQANAIWLSKKIGEGPELKT